jgi:REP element-mobilizing transposase RayT
MSRRTRVDVEGGIHHVMNRGVNRQTVFFADVDRVEFGQRLASIHRDFGVQTLAYCLMDNHYHLLLHTPHAGLSDAMQQLGGLYTRHTNDRVGRDGPLFRGRFHAIPVTTDRYLVWAARYIHRNPLAIPGVQSPTDYRWSSYRAYLGYRRCPPFLHHDPLLSHFEGDVRRLAVMTETEDVPFAAEPATIADLEQLVDYTIAADDLAYDRPQGEPRLLERTLLLLAGEHLSDPVLHTAVEQHLAAPSSAARRAAVRRARARLARDPALRRTLHRLIAVLDPARKAA